RFHTARPSSSPAGSSRRAALWLKHASAAVMKSNEGPCCHSPVLATLHAPVPKRVRERAEQNRAQMLAHSTEAHEDAHNRQGGHKRGCKHGQHVAIGVHV